MGIMDEPVGFLLYNRFSVTVALVHIFLPYVVLVLYAGFRPLSPALLESAQDLGANAWERWRRVIFPLISAPAATSFLFVFILSATDYVTPQLIGGTSGQMLGVQIQANFKAVGDWPQGAALSMLMLLAFLLCYGLTLLALRRETPGPHPLGELMEAAQRSPLSGAITVAALFFLVAPLAVVVLFSFHETASLAFPFTGFSLRWYREVLSSGPFLTATLNSLIVASIVALSTLVLGVHGGLRAQPQHIATARAAGSAVLPADHAARAVPGAWRCWCSSHGSISSCPWSRSLSVTSSMSFRISC